MAYNIACSTDDNYVQHCMAMLCSLFENNGGNTFVVHLLHHGLSSDSQRLIAGIVERYHNTIIIYDVDESYFERVKIADNHPFLSVATYYRLILPTLLDASVDKILYLDCDVIVLGDVKNLFELDLEGYGVAAVKDCTPSNDEHRQVMNLPLDGKALCAGVLMINVDYWRMNNCQENMLQFAYDMGNRLYMEDQDVLNREFRGHWYQLPYKYGYTPMAIASLDENQRWSDVLEFAFNPVIIHYAAHPKPWLDIRIPDDKYYWEYVKKSGFPNPKRFKPSDKHRKLIKSAKMRYYINYYIHPFIPDFIEIPLVDIYKFFRVIMSLRSVRRFKEYRLKLWMDKYL